MLCMHWLDASTCLLQAPGTDIHKQIENTTYKHSHKFNVPWDGPYEPSKKSYFPHRNKAHGGPLDDWPCGVCGQHRATLAILQNAFRANLIPVLHGSKPKMKTLAKSSSLTGLQAYDPFPEPETPPTPKAPNSLQGCPTRSRAQGCESLYAECEILTALIPMTSCRERATTRYNSIKNPAAFR